MMEVPTTSTFSILGTKVKPARQTLTLPAKAPPTSPPTPKAPAAKAPAPQTDDDKIAARVAALAVARQRLPDVFNDSYPPLPDDITQRLRDAVGDSATANAVRKWWTSLPGYRAARRARQQPPPASAADCADTLAIMTEVAPEVFNAANPRPLAIGVHQQLTDLGLAPEAVNTLLSYWTSRREYRAAVARGGERFNVDDTVAGGISATQQRHAAAAMSAPYYGAA